MTALARPLGAISALIFAVHASDAYGHASDRGHVLLLPTGHYVVGGALAVAASFAVLLLLSRQREGRPWRLPLLSLDERWRLPVSLLSFTILVWLIAAGLFGSRDPLSNPLPLVVWTLFWVGLTLVQGLVGNLWSWINPWFGPATIAAALRGRRLGRTADEQPLDRVACWPAVMFFCAFAWFELIDPAPDDPFRLACAVSLYAGITFAGMALFGYETWSARGEFLSVFLRMVARFGLVEATHTGSRRVSLALCLPGSKLATAPALGLSGVVLLLFGLASVSFDGLSKTFFWLGLHGINPLEYPGRTALIETNGVGLFASALVLILLFLGCVSLGERLAGSTSGSATAAGTFVWSMVPIALAYHLSHYLVVLLVNGQYALVALSDPFSAGWNLLGTTNRQVSAGIAMGSAAAWVVWNIQAVAIVGGHVLAVLAAHRLVFRLHGSARPAMLSQVPLTLLMIAYTIFGLWLLSTPTAG